jgi:hypothetical protein
VPQIDLLTEKTMCGTAALMPLPCHSAAIRPRLRTINASVSVAGSAWLTVVGLPSWPLKPTCPMSSSDISRAAGWPEAAMLAVGMSRRTLRKPQALNGTLRQFASVTSRSGAGGKSSIRASAIRPPPIFLTGVQCWPAAPITFQRASNLIADRVTKG